MMTSSNGNFSALLALCAGNSPVTDESPSQRPVTRSFDVFPYLRLNKRLSIQPRRWWFERPPCSLWRHSDDYMWYGCSTQREKLVMIWYFKRSICNPILSWCWWNFLTSANQIAQIGSCDRSRIHVPDLGGTGVWPGKMAFIKSIKTWIILLNIWLHH